MSRRRLIGIMAAVATAAALAGCGGSSSSSSTSTTQPTTSTTTTTATDESTTTTSTTASGTASISQLDAARTYVNAVRPVNAAGTAFGEKLKGFTTKTTKAEAAKAAAPYTAALLKLRPELESLAHKYPPVAQGVDRMIAAVDKLLAALDATHSSEFFSPGPWAQTVISDASSVHPIALQIRKELKAPQ